jgi:hypothetical protein
MIKKLSSFFCKHILGRVTTTYQFSASPFQLSALSFKLSAFLTPP